MGGLRPPTERRPAGATRNFFNLNATNQMKSIQFNNGEVNMKAFKFLRVVLLLGGILLSACTAAPASQNMTSAGSDKPISEVVFTGVIESMNGSQWVVNGQTITVDASTMQDGSFLVGDTIKVEAEVAADGAVTAKSVESPSAGDLAESTTSTPEPAATETSVVFDDNSNEAVGTVEAITDTSITIAGQTYTFAPGAEIKGAIEVGTIVKLHFVTNADGTLSVSEVEIANPTEAGSNNGTDDNSNGTNVNDNSSNDNSDDTNVNDNSSNDNSDDDNSNVNSNDDDQDDDNGNANSNDDNGNDDNGNDDNSNDSSSIG
jgi:hypothetical protein